MIGFLLPLLAYLLLVWIQRRRRAREIHEVTVLPSSFPFPPKLKQIGFAFQELEDELIQKDCIVVVPHDETSTSYIKQRLYKRIETVSKDGIVLVSKSLAAMMDVERPSCPHPDGILWDVFIVTVGRPALILCLVHKPSTVSYEQISRYALQLTQNVTHKIRLFTDEHVSIIDGVLDINTLENDRPFQNAIKDIIKDGSRFCNPHSLVMGERKCLHVQRAALACMAVTELDVGQFLQGKITDQRTEKELWVLPRRHFNELNRHLNKEGCVTTDLDDNDRRLLVVEIARRWEKIHPTLLCVNRACEQTESTQTAVSQVIDNEDIHDVQLKEGIRQVIAEDISERNIRLLEARFNTLERHMVINPLQVDPELTVFWVKSREWTSDLLDRFSVNFKQYTSLLSKEIEKVFRSDSKLGKVYKGCRIEYFSKGSVRAHVRIFFSDGNCKSLKRSEEIEKAFTEASSSGEQAPQEPLQIDVLPKEPTLNIVDMKTRTTKDDHGQIIQAFHDERIRDCSKLLVNTRMQLLKEIIRKNIKCLSAHDKYHGGNLLYWCALSNNEDSVKYLLNNTNIKEDILHESLAFCVCTDKSEAACLILLQFKESAMDQTDLDYCVGRTVLMQAADNGLHKIVDALLSSGANPNIRGVFSQTALHLACTRGYEKVVRVLLKPEYNVDINIKEDFNWTPMMVAADGGHQGVFYLLMELQKPDKSHVDKYGMNLLHLACKGGNLAIVKNLIDTHQFNVNSESDQGTPLMIAVRHNNTDLFQYLVDRKADATGKNKDGDSILHIACRFGSHKLIEGILNLTSTGLEDKGQHGWTPLMVAAASGEYRVFQVLIDLGANVDQQVDASENSLLHLACQGGSEDIVRSLLPRYGVHIKGEDARTPLETAQLYSQSALVKLLKQYDINM
ncbi:uncharacterized protein LOC124146889 [Haliotis rufescens]|uniref:uncharacterized protein LOC124146889 n=1 Tax=Haliotis rufescens TaxID=6454 RepID=UPI00201E8C7B|nr:uncharacterized protein LOC124146889 [Haliotis rufescens]XP_046373370.2 uncharacterized protein LOC124146889 [Haliotis rufescens]XP_046373371.2 uncharacterized protein LOC124146889 [Haliotis rufescens]